MNKYSWLFFLFLWLFVISTVANSIGLEATGVNVGIPSQPDNIVSGLTALVDIFKTFWLLLVFQVNGVPAWFSVVFVYPAVFMFLWIVVSLVRGVE